MKKIISIILAVIMITAMTACTTTKDAISDDELINIAIEISKEENNYTYWLFLSDKGVDNSDIIQKEIFFTHNGEDFTSVYDYAFVTDFNSIDDFVSNASKYLSTQYIENYLYGLIGLHPTENIPAPILLEQNGKLYKCRDIGGVSNIPNIKYSSGEVIEKTESSAIVRLYVDSSINTDITFIDYPLLLEDNIWKHNPSI